MSDVAQILGLAGPKSGANGAAASDLDQLKPSGASPSVRGKSSGNASKQKKLTGMQREVLELLESSHRASHALYQGFGKTSLKQKWQERKKSPAVKWIRKSFRNPARAALAGENGEEGLTLTHWGKAHLEQPDYVFARFNVKSEVTSYTDKEYEAALAHHQDPMMKWSKEEMDLLMKLCQRFDLRWVVISDKYNSNPIAKGAPRSVEDIKYCYYEVTRLLAEYRDKKELEKKVSAATPAASASTPVSPAATGVTTPVATITETASTSSTPIPATPTSSTSEHYKFNIAYEKQRKRQLDLAFSRTVEEENEIRSLNDELRGVEQQLKKVAVRADLKKKKELADVPYEIKRTLPTGLRQDAVGLLSLRKHLKSKQNEVQALRERYHALTGQEYKPITTPVTMSGKMFAQVTFSNKLSANLTECKTSKHSEKAIRAAKRRSSSGHPGLPAKRNKKVLR
ncbi:26S protease regulatory subunit 8 [Phytophthora nicotianae]|uniref:26S protease regulatory subunit 8 n=1 Tax=Phytophthora nicotianae TaxID=4792 RepID=A0A0W8D5N7_PHYNI|nr:26S protease regulatory subunit 8 [Phytophthora nicotianae]